MPACTAVTPNREQDTQHACYFSSVPQVLDDHLQASIPVLQIFMLFLMHAYSALVWKQQEADNSIVSAAAIEHGFQSPEGHSKLIMDGSWIQLWPCLLLWSWLQAVIGFGWLHNAFSKSSLLVAVQFAAHGVMH